MSERDGWFMVVCFTIVTVLLAGIRDRLKRIEEKLDNLPR